MNKKLFLTFSISFISSLIAMDLQVPTTIVVPEFALPTFLAYEQSQRPTRQRKPTTLQYYADFVCAEIESEQEDVNSENDFKSLEIPTTKKRSRIVLKKENDDTNKPFACHLCPKKYDQQYYLNRHLTTAHSNVRRFKCKKCPERFKLRHH